MIVTHCGLSRVVQQSAFCLLKFQVVWLAKKEVSGMSSGVSVRSPWLTSGDVRGMCFCVEVGHRCRKKSRRLEGSTPLRLVSCPSVLWRSPFCNITFPRYFCTARQSRAVKERGRGKICLYSGHIREL